MRIRHHKQHSFIFAHLLSMHHSGVHFNLLTRYFRHHFLSADPKFQRRHTRLPTLKLWIGAQEMVAEIARQQVEVNTGMMHRKQMGENEGMLFVMPYPHRTSFYMRNTLVPLSAAYIDPEGTIIEIHDLKPLDETPVEAQSDKIQYVLETPQGWFKTNNIGPGVVIRTEKGSLEQTFW